MQTADKFYASHKLTRYSGKMFNFAAFAVRLQKISKGSKLWIPGRNAPD